MAVDGIVIDHSGSSKYRGIVVQDCVVSTIAIFVVIDDRVLIGKITGHEICTDGFMFLSLLMRRRLDSIMYCTVLYGTVL